MKHTWFVMVVVSVAACAGTQAGDRALYETSEQVEEREAARERGREYRAAEEAYARGDWPDAERRFRDLAGLDSDAVEPRLRLASIASKLRRDGEAERWLRDALAIEPSRIETRYALISTLLRQRRAEDATRELQALQKYGPGDEAIELQLKATLALRVGRLEQATQFYEELLRRQMGGAAPHVGLGVVKALAGDYDGALASLDEAIALEPSSAVAYYDRALVHHRRDDRASAVTDGEAAVALDPWFMSARNNLAATLIEMGETERAVAHLERAIALRPSYAPAHGNLGVVRLGTGDVPGAIASLQRAIHHAPRVAAFHFNLGVALFRGGDADGARAAFQKVLELDPSHQDAARNVRWLDGRKSGTIRGESLPSAASDYSSGTRAALFEIDDLGHRHHTR